MVFGAILERFVQRCPIAVMVRGLLENVLSAASMDDIFRRHAIKQREGELLFSTIAKLMTLVVCRVHRSVHAAYSAAGDVEVAIKSIYNKLNGVETQVSQALVRETAQRMNAIVKQMGVKFPAVIPGLCTRIVDGNHLAATDHRLKELRGIGGGPLPAQALVVLDGDTRMVRDVIPCEDAHAQERRLVVEVIESICKKEVWIADRNFCTTVFLLEVAQRDAFFLVREHATNAPWEPNGRRRNAGVTESGRIYEQKVVLHNSLGDSLAARRITIVLNKPTENGDTEIHLLTNLPKRYRAATIAMAYRQRWRIEGAFAELDKVFEGEINTLAHPSAALFAFCLALVAYNAYRVVRAGLSAVHGIDTVETKVSSYHLGNEIDLAWYGMEVVIDDSVWERAFATLTPRQMARQLITIARNARLERYPRKPRGPKKKQPKRTSAEKTPHVATARLLNESRTAK